MTDSYSTISLAPTARATCKRSKEKIEIGELRLSHYYTPKGRNHMECANFKLCKAAPRTLQRLVNETPGGVDAIRGMSELENDVRQVAKRIITAVSNDRTPDEHDVKFRAVVAPKKRKTSPLGSDHNDAQKKTTKDESQNWDLFKLKLKQFETTGTGSLIDNELLDQFPIFHGTAPPNHPYPQAFTDGAFDDDYCVVRKLDEDLVVLSRKLPSGRYINIDTCEFALLNGGRGIAHLDMNNANNELANLKSVDEVEARQLLLNFSES